MVRRMACARLVPDEISHLAPPRPRFSSEMLQVSQALAPSLTLVIAAKKLFGS